MRSATQFLLATVALFALLLYEKLCKTSLGGTNRSKEEWYLGAKLRSKIVRFFVKVEKGE
jgi:hypothetical protein